MLMVESAWMGVNEVNDDKVFGRLTSSLILGIEKVCERAVWVERECSDEIQKERRNLPICVWRAHEAFTYRLLLDVHRCLVAPMMSLLDAE